MTTATIAAPSSTTGFMCMWNGTKDNEPAYVDYATGKTNVNEPKRVEVVVQNIRTLDNKPTLKQNGYELCKHSTNLSPEQLLNSMTPDGRKSIEEVYYGECRAIIRELTGAPVVEPYIFRVRQNGANPRDFGSKNVANAAMTKASLPIAHVDRDRHTLRDGIVEHFGRETAAELMSKYKRFAQINVWRGINDVVRSWPLAFVDHSKVPGWDYDTHMAVVEPRNDPRVALRGPKSQDSVLKCDEAYSYYYASDMTRDEVFVFSSGDSDVSKVVPHGAFWDYNSTDNAPTRCSIEVRAWVFFDN
ncbi:hypothetical protein QBC42DRAFT_229060 [Cladorrhinum samala]|uniref:Uncharacterized protein n=1 Tax=Cladorrhinum samala TaxID=585594 RepID=A0AAV9HLP5_9PEZI|nr:hypothetical protein QBC42DRAFT_229060 [Cladorrhinum samala]